MFSKILKILGTVATIVAGAYAVISYHVPNDQTSNNKAPVIQQSLGNYSTNILGNGNTVNSR